MCFDGTKRLAHIRGKLRKRQWINTQDIILVGLRDYQDAKADVIMKYNSDEARRLKNMGHLPESVNVVDGNEVEDDIFFDNESDENSEDEIAPQPYQPIISSESESDDSDESDQTEVKSLSSRKKIHFSCKKI